MTEVAATPVSPDCAQDKHAACIGEAWCEDHDQVEACGCWCHDEDYE